MTKWWMHALLVALLTTTSSGLTGDALAQGAPPDPPAGAPPVDEAAPSDPASTPSDKAMDEARERYKRGTELYDEGAYEQALIEFERAYDLAPAYRILYNIAQVAVLLPNYPKAIRAYEKFLVDGGENVAEARRISIKKQLETLRQRVGFITVTANVDGAQVLVDDLVVGMTPLAEPVMVNAGRHNVAARKRGLSSDSESVVLAGTDAIQVKLELLQPTAGTTLVVPQPGTPDTPSVESTSYVWIGWLVTGVLAAGAVGAGVATLSATNELDDLRNTPNVTTQQLDDQQGTARAVGITADALIVSAILAGGVTLYFTIDELLDDGTTEADVAFGIGPGSAVVTGSF